MAAFADGTTVAIGLGDDELLGVHLLAKLEGVAETDHDAFGDMLRFTLQRGIAERLAGAGMEWPPTADAFDLANSVRKEPAPEKPAAVVMDGMSRGTRIRIAALGVALVALVIAIIGGYAGHWSWTGFDSNNQVWDWLSLLLLPVAFGTFPLWLRFSEYMSSARQRALGTIVAVFVVFVLLGYLAPLGWTGFRGQTLWDWLTLIILPVTIMTVRTWPTTGRDVKRVHIAAVAVVLAGLTVTVIGGYEGSWSWTGYQGNTLWDWLHLILAPVAVSTVVVPSLIKLVSGAADQRAEEERAGKAREQALRAARARTAASST
jgi:hypothetical protein